MMFGDGILLDGRMFENAEGGSEGLGLGTVAWVIVGV